MNKNKMHVYYKFGLLTIFIFSFSICHIQASPAKNQNSSASIEDDYDYDDDYYDDQGRTDDFTSLNAALTTTTTYRPTFKIPRRSNHEPVCPRACFCREDFKYVQCVHAQLTHVPHDLPRTALIVDLSHNAIAELHPDDFANCTKIVEINLNSNKLTKLDKEVFTGLTHLQRLRIVNNHLTQIEPNTFEDASDLSLLDLSNNSIVLRPDGSFLYQPSLREFICSNCSWTELFDQTFANLSGLTTLRLQQNNFNQKINTRAFTPLRNLIKLKLPELDQQSVEELCNLLKSIDNISFKRFDISCFELVLGTSYNESLIFATDPPFKHVVTGLEPAPTIVSAAKPPTKASSDDTRNAHKKSSKMASEFNLTNTATNASIEVIKAGVVLNSSGTVESSGTTTDPEKPYQVPISQETINTLLIGIMLLAVVGIVIGLICRKDVGGIKTKCCRTRKPEPKDQVHPTEEIPLNKLA